MPVLNIPFIGPLTESASTQLSPPGTVVEQKNMRLLPQGGYRKVLSPSTAAITTSDSSTLTEVTSVNELDGTTIITALTGDGLHRVYHADGSELELLSDRAPAFVPGPTRRLGSTIENTGTRVSYGDFASLNGIDAYACVSEDAAGSTGGTDLYIMAVDSVTGRVIATQLLAVSYAPPRASSPRLLTCGQYIMAFVPDTALNTKIALFTLDTSNPLAWISRGTPLDGVAQPLGPFAERWDVVKYDETKAVAVYATSSAGEYRLRFIPADGVSAGPETIVSTGIGTFVTVGITAGFSTVCVAACDSASGTSVAVRFFNSVLVQTATQGYGPSTSRDPLKPRLQMIDAVSAYVAVAFRTEAPVGFGYHTNLSTVHANNGQTQLSVHFGVLPASRIFSFAGRVYMFASHAVSTSSTFGGGLSMLEIPPTALPFPVSARTVFVDSYTSIYSAATSMHAANVTVDSTRGILVALPVITTAIWEYLAYTGLGAEVGRSLQSFTVQPIGAASPARISIPQCCATRDGLFVPSAFPQLVYANGEVSELGFAQTPAMGLAPATVGGGGLTLLGVYAYSGYFEWTDPNGRLVRSNISAPQLKTLAGSENSVTVRPSGVSSTSHNLRASATRLQVARGTASGTVFYTATNDALAGKQDQSSYSDRISDVNITRHAPLYTEGGFLPAEPPPPCSLAAYGSGRLWVAGQADPTRVTASQPADERYGLAFSAAPEFSMNVPYPVTALWAMDGALIAFCEDSIWVVAGDGPNNRGSGAFAQPRRVPSSVGCIDHRSLVEVPDGLMFYHRGAFWMLPRGLSAPVRISDAIATSAEGLQILSVVATQDEDGRAIVMWFPTAATSPNYFLLDLQLGAWSVVTNAHAIGYATRASNYVGGLTANATSLVTGWGTTGTVSLPGSFRMAAMRPNGLLGRARMRAVAVLTEYLGDSITTVEAYDGQEWSVIDEFESSARYGETAGTLHRRVIELPDALRDSEQFSVRFSDAPISGTVYTRGPIYHGVAVEYTPEDGLARVVPEEHV